MDINKIQRITKNTKCLIYVNFTGHVENLDTLKKFALKIKLNL